MYGGLPTQGQHAEQQEKAKQQEQMRKDLLQKILSPEAQTRLGTLAVAKPDKARQLEDMVLMMAQKGQVKEQITDGQFKHMLEGMSSSEAQPKMTYTRRGAFDDEDDDSAHSTRPTCMRVLTRLANRPAPTAMHYTSLTDCSVAGRVVAVDDLLDGL